MKTPAHGGCDLFSAGGVSLEGVMFEAPSVRVFFNGEKIERLMGARKLS